MPTLLRRRLRLARRGAWYVVAGVLVCMALVLGVASQVLPLAERHPDKIAGWLSARAGRPIAFDHVETQWTRRGPLLRLDGLRLGEGADAVRVGEAEILVSMYAGLLPGRSFTELRLRGLSLTLRRADDGMWSVLGLPGQTGGGDPLKNLEGLGELQVIGGKLSVQAPSLGWNVSLPRIDLRLRVDGDRVRAGTRAWARTDATPVQAAFDFDRGSGNGRAYVDTQVADIAAWAPLLRYAGVASVRAQARVPARTIAIDAQAQVDPGQAHVPAERRRLHRQLAADDLQLAQALEILQRIAAAPSDPAGRARAPHAVVRAPQCQRTDHANATR